MDNIDDGENMNTQKPDAVELLPCPFCGKNSGQARHVGWDSYHCSDTECPGHELYASRFQWNTRDTAERDALKAAVGAMEYANRWKYLPELPKEEGEYIVSLTDGTVTNWWIYRDDVIGHGLVPKNVIAWRPLPEPAKIREPGPQEQVEVS